MKTLKGQPGTLAATVLLASLFSCSGAKEVTTPTRSSDSAPATLATPEKSTTREEPSAPEQNDEPGADYFIFAAREDQGIVNPRTGRLSLMLTDLVVKGGEVNLEVKRSFRRESANQGLLGARWRLNWVSRLDRIGQIVLLYEWSGPVIFKAKTGERTFRSPSSDTLVLKGKKAVRRRPDGIRELFDAEGRLAARKLRNGKIIALKYDSSGRLMRIDGPAGVFLQFVADEDGRLTRARASNGAEVNYVYANDLLTEVSSNRRPTVGYVYNPDGLLSRIEHPQFGNVQFTIDDKQRILSRHWADGSRERYEYDDQAGTVRRIDADGAVTEIRTSPDHRREEIINALGHKTVIEYDDAGRIQQATGPTGQKVRLTYDEQGRTVKVENPAAAAVQLEYESSGRSPSTIVGPGGNRRKLEYDSRQNVIAIKGDDDREGVALEYDSTGKVKKVRSSDGREFGFTYDTHGRPAGMTDPAGNTSHLEYDASGNLLREVDALGGITSRTYDERGRLASLTDATGGTTRYEYKPNGLLAGITDASGAKTTYHYQGRTMTVTDPNGQATRYEYTPTGRLASITGPVGETVRFEYDAAGNLARTVNPLGGVTARTYDPLGRLTGITDPGGATVRYEYSPAGRLAKRIDPSGQTTRYQYDQQGQLVKLIDDAGHETTQQYACCGRVERINTPQGRAIEFDYDKQGNLSQIKKDDRETVNYQYDVLGRPVKEKYPSGLEISFRYDAVGNLLSWQDSLGGDRSMRYDALGRLIEAQDSTGAVTRLRYDLAGNLLDRTDALGRKKQFRYTEGGQLVQIVEANGDTAKYEYDDAGNLTTIHHPSGGQSEFVYDAIGNIQQSTDPLGNTEHASYDKAGRLISTTDAERQETSYAYDSAGRLVQKRLADGSIVGYRYDRRGRLAEVDDGVFVVRYQYDAFGNTTRIEYPAINKSLQYRYDQQGRLAEFTTPSGETTAYQYDALDRLMSIKTAHGSAISFIYDPKGRLSSLTYPNGVRGTWQYDSEDRIVKIRYAAAAGKVLSGRQYRYDAVDNPIEVIDSDGRTLRYEYDEAGQLVSETAGDGTKVKYTYFAGGNRATRETSGEVVKYRYDEADRLLQAGDETFKYDAGGNLIERNSPAGTIRYTYDAQGQLVKVDLPGGKEVTFGYAPTGERIWREDGDGKTYFVTDGVNLLGELDGARNLIASYVHAPNVDDPLMMVRGDRVYYYHKDGLGSVTHLTDAAGNVVAEYAYDAFGRIQHQEIDVLNPFLFNSREHDAATGLYYHRARYYDPEQGRFITADPVGPVLDDLVTLNPYLYATNNPLKYVDPFGTSPEAIQGILHQLEQLRRTQAWLYETPRYGESASHVLARDMYNAQEIGSQRQRVNQRIGALEAELARHRQQLGGYAGPTRRSPGVRPPDPHDLANWFDQTRRSPRAQAQASSGAGGIKLPPRATGNTPLAPTVKAPRVPSSAGPRLQGLSSSSYPEPPPPGRSWGQSPATLGGGVVLGAVYFDCIHREQKSPDECASQVAKDTVIDVGGGAVMTGGSIWIAGKTFGGAGAATIGAGTLASAAGGLGAAAIAVYGPQIPGEASAWWDARTEAERAERQARGSQLMSELFDELHEALEDELRRIQRMPRTISESYIAVAPLVRQAETASQTARIDLRAMEGEAAKHADKRTAAGNAETVRNALGVVAADLDRQADAVIQMLDTADAASDSPTTQKAYEKAAGKVADIGALADDVKQRNQELNKLALSLEGAEKALASLGTKAKLRAHKNRIQNVILAQIKQKRSAIERLTRELPIAKAGLIGRANRVRNVTAPEASDQRSVLANIINQVQRVTAPEGLAEKVTNQVTAVQTLAGEVENLEWKADQLLASISNKQVPLASDAVRLASSAYKRAKDRLGQRAPDDDTLGQMLPDADLPPGDDEITWAPPDAELPPADDEITRAPPDAELPPADGEVGPDELYEDPPERITQPERPSPDETGPKATDLDGTYGIYAAAAGAGRTTRGHPFETVVWKGRGDNQALLVFSITTKYPDQALAIGKVDRRASITATRRVDSDGNVSFLAAGPELKRVFHGLGRVLALSASAGGTAVGGGRDAIPPEVTVTVKTATVTFVPKEQNFDVSVNWDMNWRFHMTDDEGGDINKRVNMSSSGFAKRLR